MKALSVLGSTGSIGTQTLEIVEDFPDRFRVVALTAGWVLLASLLGLAILEHVLMMFPVPLQKLWGWAMSHRHEAGFVQPLHRIAPSATLAPAALLPQGDKP